MTNSKLYQTLIGAALIQNEDDLEDAMVAIFHPDKLDERELGLAFEETIGYNPMVYHDDKKIREILDCVAKEKPELRAFIEENEEGIVETVLQAITEEKPEVIAATTLDCIVGLSDEANPAAIAQVISSFTGIDVGLIDDDEYNGYEEDDTDDDIDYDEDEFEE